MGLCVMQIILILMIFVLFGSTLWFVPKRQVRRLTMLAADERLKIENETRKILAEILGGAFVLFGLVFTWETVRSTAENLRISQDGLRVSQESLRISQEGQITERFTRAIEQLGKVDEAGKESNLAIRLGGIRGLERLADDSKRDYWPIMQILTTYVREHAYWREPKVRQTFEEIPEPKPDVKFILDVFGRRSNSYRNGEDGGLDLSGTDLRRATLNGFNFNGANFNLAHLEKARLKGIQLKEGLLVGANLSGADLEQAELERADLRGAIFTSANLSGAVLTNAQLDGADFRGVNLKGVRNLTRQQLESAITDSKTQLPDNL